MLRADMAVPSWSFEGYRYFGAQGPEIKKTRLVVLKEPGSPEGFYDSKLLESALHGIVPA
jgi:hypothetical protein